jgi:hypothetical protein
VDTLAEWVRLVKEFLNQDFAGCRHVAKCPYTICQNYKFLNQDEVQVHLCQEGFMPNYLVCRDHGEVEPPVIGAESDRNEDDDRMDEMLADIGREYEAGSREQGQPLEVQNFYRLLAAVDKKVHDGTDVTVLQAVTRLMAMKSKYNFSNQCYNDIVKLIIYLIPTKHNMPKDLYQSKKIVSGLSMNYEKIDVCEKNCMLFWKEHKNDTECMHCGRSRYVKVRNEDGVSVNTKVAIKQLCYVLITPRLKQLFLFKEIAKQMRWHHEGKRESEDPDIMSHPADSEAWQTLDRFDPEFARDPRSVRLSLSTYGFQHHSTDSHPYSCWPVFMMPYNLPPDKCVKEGFIFLALVIPGPKEPKKQMNMFLQPLFEDLKNLWSGVDAYDSHLK